MKKTVLRLIALSVLLAGPVHALGATEIKGVTFDDTYQIGAETLKLNGAGVRVKIIVNVYAAGLYVPRPDSNVARLIEADAPRSVQVVLLRKLTGEEFAEAMMDGFQANNSAAEVARFESQLKYIRQTMLGMGTVAKGTVVNIDYLPGLGTRVLLQGKPVGEAVKGLDFNQALMRIWLGPDPVDTSLKRALLGSK